MNNLEKHWNQIYSTKSDNEVSWYQENPETSINLIQQYTTNKNDEIIDIGGGNSNLAKALCTLGYKKTAILDISEHAITISKTKLSNCKNHYTFINNNILSFKAETKYRLWHDRAVFHFLTTTTDISRYIEIASNSIVQNGYLVLATFSKTGPKKCSGLPICQYNKQEIEVLFSKSFMLIDSFKQTHETPFNTQQNFIWNVLKKI